MRKKIIEMEKTKMKNAYSKQQFARSEFDATGYRFLDKEGVFNGTLLFKRWGKRKDLLAYFEFDDGGKILCSAWQEAKYLGLPDIEIGSRVTAHFEKQRNGKVRLISVMLEGK